MKKFENRRYRENKCTPDFEERKQNKKRKMEGKGEGLSIYFG